MWKFARMCLNWKILLAVAAVGVLIWVVAPNVVLKGLPLLLLAACALSMLAMASRMRRGMEHDHYTQGAQERRSSAPDMDRGRRLVELQAKQTALDREIAQLRAEVEGDRDVQLSEKGPRKGASSVLG